MTVISCYYVRLSGCYPSLFAIAWEHRANVRQMLQSSSQWTVFWQEVVIYTHTHTHTNTQAFKPQPSSTTFYRRRKDALARFSSLAARHQMKREVHQQVTFSNIRPLLKIKNAAAYFNSDSQPATLTYSSPPYLQPRLYTEMALKDDLSDSPIFARVSPSAAEHEMTCRTASHTFHHFFIIPLFCALSRSLSLTVSVLSCTFELSPPPLILFPKMALCLSGRLVRAAVWELRRSQSFFQPSVNEQDERERERGERERGEREGGREGEPPAKRTKKVR